jgi:hypothetical protein
MIVAACEVEMTGLGFTKVGSGADVTRGYYTVARHDVDPKALDKIPPGGAPTKIVGRLVVIMRSTVSTEQLWTAQRPRLRRSESREAWRDGPERDSAAVRNLSCPQTSAARIIHASNVTGESET